MHYQCQARGGRGWPTHENLTVRCVSRVGILIVCDIPGVGNFDNVAILISGESGEGLEMACLGKYPEGI